jgi:expansin
MRFENVLSAHVLMAVGVLGLTACFDSSDEPGGPIIPISDMKEGMAVSYSTDGSGNCNFDASPDDLNVAALNSNDYALSAMCGACVEVEGPSGKVRARVVDVCPGCTADQLALSKQAFGAMGSSDFLEVNMRWRYVTCPVAGPVRYRIKEGSNPYWAAIQVRNHRLPIQKLEWEKGGEWVPLNREPYNYFVEPSGMGEGPVRLRVTASDGQLLEDTLPRIFEGLVIDGSSQFSAD